MICLKCTGTRHNDEVDAGEFMLIQPKGFTYNSLQTIPAAGQSDVSLGDC